MPRRVRGESLSRTVATPDGPSDTETGVAWEALASGAMLVDRSTRARARFSGPGRVEVLDGLLTNDVSALVPGSGEYAALLTPKGKIVADVRIFARRDDLLVDVPERAAEGWWLAIRKYVNPRLARYADVSGALGDTGLFGARAARLLHEVTGVDEEAWKALPPYAHRTLGDEETGVLVAQVPDLGVPGFELFGPVAAVASLAQRLHAAGAVPGSGEAFEIARIEAGRPEWGLDIDDSTLVQEANLDAWHAVSYTKGCYTGQETVARVHFRGHVNRHLRGLLVAGPEPPPHGAAVSDAAGTVVGDVRSAARSPRLGPIALAMVRREMGPDAEVRVTWDARTAGARVVALPFPAPG